MKSVHLISSKYFNRLCKFEPEESILAHSIYIFFEFMKHEKSETKPKESCQIIFWSKIKLKIFSSADIPNFKTKKFQFSNWIWMINLSKGAYLVLLTPDVFKSKCLKSRKKITVNSSHWSFEGGVSHEACTIRYNTDIVYYYSFFGRNTNLANYLFRISSDFLFYLGLV